MANLREIYLEGRDIKESEIPDDWKGSFYKFMTGQACSVEVDENGNVKEYIYYGCDFRLWYHQNEKAIERDIKIEEIRSENSLITRAYNGYDSNRQNK